MRKAPQNSWIAKAALSLTGVVVLTDVSMATAHAEATISVYGGHNSSPHSDITYDFGPNSNIAPGSDVGVGWDGLSFQSPPFYGVRGTWWFDSHPEFGVAVDFTHAKVKANPLPTGFSVLEFTDGINFLTANGLYRHQFDNGFSPYAGVGVGLAIPHVEADDGVGGAPKTFEYQVTGVAAQAFVGVDYSFTERWSVFGEYKFAYADVNADLNDGGNLDTWVFSNQVIFGVSFKLF